MGIWTKRSQGRLSSSGRRLFYVTGRLVAWSSLEPLGRTSQPAREEPSCQVLDLRRSGLSLFISISSMLPLC